MLKRRVGKIFVTTVLASAIAACSKPLSHDELLNRADSAYRDGQLNAAMIDVRTALQEHPDSAAARRLHGEILMAQRASVDAAANFERSLQSEESAEVAALYAKALNDSAQSRQVLALHEEGRFDYAKEEPAYIAQWVIASVRAGQGDQAQDTLFDALEAHPDHPQLELAHAYLLLQHNRSPMEAARILERLTNAEGRWADAWSYLGLAHQLSGERDSAVAAYAKAVELNAFRFEDRIALISLLIDAEDYQTARQHLAQLENVDHPSMHFAEARLLLVEEDRRGAVQKLQQVLAAQPDHIGALYLSGVANAQLGNFSTAETQLRRFLRLVPGHLDGSLTLAQVYLSLEEPTRAESLMRRVLEQHPDDTRVVNVLGIAIAAQGGDPASTLFEDLASGTPDSPLLRLQLGSQLLRAGEMERGISELEAARDLDPHSPDIRGNLVLAHLLNNNDEAAQAEVDDYLSVADEQPDSHLLAARLALHQGDFDAARAHYERAQEIHPDNPDSRDGLALVAMQQGDEERALALLEDAEDLDGMLKYALVHEHRGDETAMLQALQRAASAYPDRIDPHLTEARYYFRVGEYQKAVDKAESMRPDYPDEPQVYQLLTGSYLSLDDGARAREAAEKLLELVPDNPRALRLAAQAELVSGNAEVAEAHLKTILDNQPDDLATRQLLLEVLLQQGKIAELDEQLQLLPEGFLPEAQLLTARGRLALETGRLDEAEPLLRQAFEQEPNSTTLVFLTHVLSMKDDMPTAVNLLESWLEEHPDDSQALHQVGTIYIAQGQDDEAIEVYERLVAQSPDDVVALNNLAWSYRDIEQDRALTLAEKAADLAPDSAAITDTHAMVLFHRGEFDKALAVNEKALGLEPKNPQLRYHRARILAEAGSNSEAVSILEAIASEEVPFPGRSEALELLSELKGS